MSQLVDVLIICLATLRLTRLVTTDDLGEWMLRGPLQSWAYRRDRAAENESREKLGLGPLPPFSRVPTGWRTKLTDGLDCPHCVGYWLGLLVLLAALLAGAPSTLPWLASSPLPLLVWRVICGSLALNYLVGHISARLDRTTYEES